MRWKKIALLNRKRNGNPTIFVNYAADAMMAGGKKRCPGYLTVLNCPHAFTKVATELLCFLPMLKRRKSEKVTTDQMEIEWTITNKAIAFVLALLEEANLQVSVDFLIPNGQITKVNICVFCLYLQGYHGESDGH